MPWLIGFLAFVFLGYWLAPLWNWLGPVHQPARAPHFAPVRTRSLLPLPLEIALQRFDEPLKTLGFDPTPPIRDARDAGKVRGGTSGVAQLWRHAATGDIAAVLALLNGKAGAVTVLSLSTRLADGTIVETNNAPTPGVIPTHPDVRRARFPREQSPQRLVALHRARVAEAGAVDPEPLDDPAALQRAREEHAIAWMVGCGYMRRTRDGLRYTLKGACMAPWRQLFPLAWLEKRENEAERRRLAAKAKLPTSAGPGRSWSSRLLFE